MHLTKRCFIRIICYPLAVCAVLSACTLKRDYALKEKEKQLALIYTASSLGLCESTLKLSEAMLEITLCANAQRLTELSHTAAENAARAKQFLTVFGSPSAQLNCFYTSAAEFALNACCDLSAGYPREAALEVSRNARRIYESLALPAEEALSDASFSESLGQKIMSAADGISFPQGVLEATAKATATPMTAALPLITREQAALKAAEYLGIPPVLMRGGGEVGGIIELYCFSYSDTDICVTKNGGIIYSLVCEAPCGEVQLNPTRGREIAYENALKLGYDGMTCIEQSVSGSHADYVFVKNDNGVLVYPDKLKISVCLATGKITQIDASEYLCNHSSREKTAIPQDMSKAELLLPEGFKHIETVLAIINTDGAECLCYRIEGSFGGITARIFYDTASLEEKKIEIFGK